VERKGIFREPQYSPVVGTLLVLPGVVAYYVTEVWTVRLSQSDRLSLAVLGFVSVWIAGFFLCFGKRCLRAAVFPLFFLVLMIPLPAAVLDRFVFTLQVGSASVTYTLFKFFSVPVLWQGFRFSLPGVDIEIAKECSGIRSSTALFITGMLASHVFLRSSWKKLGLSLGMIPIAIFKNAVRIVTISSLGVYVDRSFLYGRLHHWGGLLFALIALAMFVPLLFALQKLEARSRKNHQPGPDREFSSAGAVFGSAQ
jgi:exosortase